MENELDSRQQRLVFAFGFGIVAYFLGNHFFFSETITVMTAGLVVALAYGLGEPPFSSLRAIWRRIRNNT